MYQLKAFIVATTPTACGIETALTSLVQSWSMSVATTPTACGIETSLIMAPSSTENTRCNNTYRLRY